MKYLAILKDSIREAIDNKVIYVMIGLSLLVTLFVLTISFTPLPPREMMQRAVNGKLMDINAFGEGGAGPHGRPPWMAPKAIPFTVQKVEPLRGGDNSPESAYRVVVNLVLPTREQAEEVRKAPGRELTRLRNNLTFAQEVGAFKVGAARLAPAGKVEENGEEARTVTFEFTTEPTEGARLGWAHEYSMFGGAMSLGGGAPLGLVLVISVILYLWMGSLVTLLVSLIITAFFIPNMLRKGTVDLLLVKPIHRWTLLVYKYVGGLTFIFVNTAIAMAGIWLALGLRSGVWAHSLWLLVFIYTFFFAILYAVSALFGVLTRSAIVSILVTCGVWFLLFVIGQIYGFGEMLAIQETQRNVPAAERTSDNAFWKVMRGIHFVLPRTTDLNQLGNQALLRDFTPPTAYGKATRSTAERNSFNWTESITVSLVFIAVMLGLGCWRFATKDY